MGPCRVCGEYSGYGFSEPGPRSQRKRKGYVWACEAHRDEVRVERDRKLGLMPSPVSRAQDAAGEASAQGVLL